MAEIKLRPIVFKVVPPPPYVLLDEKAVADYAQGGKVMYAPPTFTTDKDFICYKMSANRTGSDSDVILSYYNSNTRRYYGWYWHQGQDGSGDYQYVGPDQETSGQSLTQLVAGADGVQRSSSSNTYEPNPMIPSSSTEFTTAKFVFQKSTRKMYFYIEDKQVAICNDWTTSWNPLTTNITSGWIAGTTFGIQVYACDSLEAAEQC